MLNILLVDDEELERIYLRKLLEKYDGFKVIGEACNGKEAILMTKKYSPDIIFMDIKMPGLNGFEATKIIKEFNANTGIIILSAYDEADFAQDSLRAGAIEYLLKPATPDEIFAVLKRRPK